MTKLFLQSKLQYFRPIIYNRERWSKLIRLPGIYYQPVGVKPYDQLVGRIRLLADKKVNQKVNFTMSDSEQDNIMSQYEEFGTEEEYFKKFNLKKKDLGKEELEGLVEKILDFRKFEIELYWKRAAYYWTFIAGIIAGFFLISSSSKANDELIKLRFLLNCLGIVFSMGWYCVNRGSKYWQENWESHLDIMEDKVFGPLYKTNVSKSREKFVIYWEHIHFHLQR